MSNKMYNFKQTQNKRWGIYLQDRLLATIGSYEACQYIEQLSTEKLSDTEVLKAAIAYQKSIDKSLSIKNS